MAAALVLLTLAASAGCGGCGGEDSLRPVPSATGRGGAASTIDPRATRAALDVLRDGGNAVDAAVAASAVLGVTDLQSCGVGGGGFMLVHLAADGSTRVIEHREPAPAAFRRELFYADDGRPLPFEQRVASGVSTGVPGLVAGWDLALRRFGTRTLGELLQPAIRVAEEGFDVDQGFVDQTTKGLARLQLFAPSRALLLTPTGEPLPVGTHLRNPDLARTYRLLAERGADAFYRGELAGEIVDTLVHPPLASGVTQPVRAGVMTEADLAAYSANVRPALETTYRGYTLRGAGPPSGGGLAVGLLLHLLEGSDLGALSDEELYHRFLEASRLTYADRDAYVADPAFFDVPVSGLLSAGYAELRRGEMSEPGASVGAALPGNPYPFEGNPGMPPAPVPPPPPPADGTELADEGSTTHITVVDADGNVAAYSCSLEQEGGNGMVVPGRGFLLNNELTNFDVPPSADMPLANVGEPLKRPRSSMSPTLVLKDGRPVLTLGSPGGATIITTVALVLVRALDRGMSLEDAVAAPRVTQRNLPSGRAEAEPGFLALPEAAALIARGHRLVPTEPPLGLGAVTAVVFNADGTLTAAAEPVRRGGGNAGVVSPP
ncbi:MULTISPECIES: gamma-glutamyltransferase [Myxococcaceae]|uniref:gamma-glutamyltransferase n=1 Tax=Myxococcaceae TaxID=31 RepID=UPI001E3FA135|nr:MULTISPECIES: gamma-glutamyltransferase [Myxococcaceae]